MKEIREIVSAFNKAKAEGKRVALATVVEIEGSSYRQPGARMLVTEDGMLTGAISGGCLEGDALRKALLVIVNNAPMLVTYDTNDEEDSVIGIGLGCNGIIQILIEPVDMNVVNNPVALLERLISQRTTGVITTVYSVDHRKSLFAGTVFLYNGMASQSEHITSAPFYEKLTALATSSIDNQQSVVSDLGDADNHRVLCSVVQPALMIVIIGAGNDVRPVVSVADTLGWETTIIDGRASHATTERFPRATCLMLYKPEEALTQLNIDSRTVFLLMTHNYNYDYTLLAALINTPTPYIGILGPRKKTSRMLAELNTQGINLKPLQQRKIFGPMGLDTGGENAEDIALSVCAEINAVLHGRTGGNLRDRDGSIHAHSFIRAGQ